MHVIMLLVDFKLNLVKTLGSVKFHPQPMFLIYREEELMF